MTPPPIWNETVQTKYVEGDFYRKWKLSSLFQALQEAAANHAQHLGFGYDQIIPQDLAWVLARLKIRFNSFPFAGERVALQTWPKGLQQKLFFMRDFTLQAEGGGKVYALASSAWLVINTRTRRMQPPNALPFDLPDNDGRSALNEPLEKITTSSAMPEQFRIQARTSMLDLLGHVTSARYLDWIADCFPVEAFQNDALAWLQINFNREVKLGEQVSVACARSAGDGGTWLVQGTNLDTGANAFDASLGFRVAFGFRE